MSYKSYRTNMTNKLGENLTFIHGGYRDLKSFQMSTIVYDLTVEFCEKFINKKSRTHDQMVQAARSGRQNIAEGSQASGTSKKTEIKLTSVARASLEELLLDYEDFLRQSKLKLWAKDDPNAKTIRSLAYSNNKSSSFYQSYLQNPESAANMLICIIHQTNYLLDQQIKKLNEEFLQKGGFTERIYWKRKEIQNKY